MTKKELVERIGRDCRLTRNQASHTQRSIRLDTVTGPSRRERVSPPVLEPTSVKRGLVPSRRRPRTRLQKHRRRLGRAELARVRLRRRNLS